MNQLFDFPSTSEPDADEILQVFAHWVLTCRTPTRGPKPKLTDKRRKRIAKALKDYGLDACLQAIEGVQYSSWHMGGNPQGKKYDDLELILRDEKHIEMFATYAAEVKSTAEDFETWMRDS